MQVGVEKLPFLQASVLRGNGLLHFDDHGRLAKHSVSTGQDLGSGGFVLFVGESAALPRLRFHHDTVTVLAQRVHTGRRHADAVLVILDLFGNSNDHRPPRPFRPPCMPCLRP